MSWKERGADFLNKYLGVEKVESPEDLLRLILAEKTEIVTLVSRLPEEFQALPLRDLEKVVHGREVNMARSHLPGEFFLSEISETELVRDKIHMRLKKIIDNIRVVQKKDPLFSSSPLGRACQNFLARYTSSIYANLPSLLEALSKQPDTAPFR